jgi:protoporphyrinogen oxidase
VRALQHGCLYDFMMDRRFFLKTIGLLGALAATHSRFAAGNGSILHNTEEMRRLVALDEQAATRAAHAPRAAVIGAGVAGLSAARTLEQAGWQVDVFEKDPAPGGFCSTLDIDGFTFDLGPHVFNGSIRHVVPFKPDDLDPAVFSESFLIGDRFLNFPNDLLTPSYIPDMVATLARNTWNPERLNARDMESLATASYGDRATADIFRPLIEKWCRAPLSSLDSRYFASRMHGKLTAETAKHFVGHGFAVVEKSLSRPFRGSGNDNPTIGPDGIPDAAGYAGRIGAQIVPHRLAEGMSSLRIHPNRPVRALGVEQGRIVSLEADGMQMKPDVVVSTAPLNSLAGMIRGANDLESLAGLQYLNVVFIFVRIRRNRLLNTEWTWIPDAGVPFYRMSEMKVLNSVHAPKGATGLCLEATLADRDPKLKEPADYWKRLATDFLKRVFSLHDRDIIGMDVQTRACAYPDFTVKNTALIAGCTSKPYGTGQTTHRFRTGIENLVLAGRAGTFVYLLTPAAIISGQKAAKEAMGTL